MKNPLKGMKNHGGAREMSLTFLWSLLCKEESSFLYNGDALPQRMSFSLYLIFLPKLFSISLVFFSPVGHVYCVLSVSKSKCVSESIAGECYWAVYRAISSSLSPCLRCWTTSRFVGIEELSQCSTDVIAKEMHCPCHKVHLNIKNKWYLQCITLY